mmetsp:Transcript_83806/g.98080  ORF Transcript_83806/g.98080 Transcript_83806/m.98080 type:complete len:645 (-) Transcript_83806:188-2122(-)
MRLVVEESPWERWTSAVAAEAAGSSSDDVSLLARQVFNELKTDSTFSWLLATKGSQGARPIGVAGPLPQLASMLYPTSMNLNTAHELLRAASPHLPEIRLQSVLSAVVSLSQNQRATFLTVSEWCVGNPKSWSGDVAPGLIGLVVLSWIASRCCSLQDAIRSCELLLRDVLAAATCVLVEPPMAIIPSEGNANNVMSYQHVQRWASDRWLGRWASTLNPVVANSPIPSLCVTPQRSGRASPVANDDSSAAPEEEEALPTLLPLAEEPQPTGVIPGSFCDYYGMPLCDEALFDENNDDARMWAQLWTRGVTPSVSVEQAAPPREEVLLHLGFVVVRQVMDVLLAHCPMPVIDRMVEDCFDDVIKLMSCRSSEDLIEFEWALILAIARRWDIGVGGKFMGSYVSTLAASHFDATQWLVGSEGSETGGNPSFVVRGIGSFATAGSEEGGAGGISGPTGNSFVGDKHRISFALHSPTRRTPHVSASKTVTTAPSSVKDAELPASSDLPARNEPTISPKLVGQSNSVSNITIGTARHVVDANEPTPSPALTTPQTPLPASSLKYEIADGNSVANIPPESTAPPTNTLRKEDNETLKKEKKLRRRSLGRSLGNSAADSGSGALGDANLDDIPDTTETTERPNCGGCCLLM